MALTRTSVDPKQQRPLGNVTILTASAWPSRPKAMQGMPEPAFQSLSLISFVYIKDLNDLHKYLLILPKSAFAPDMLVLDDSLEDFIDNQFKVNSSNQTVLIGFNIFSYFLDTDYLQTDLYQIFVVC